MCIFTLLLLMRLVGDMLGHVEEVLADLSQNFQRESLHLVLNSISPCQITLVPFRDDSLEKIIY